MSYVLNSYLLTYFLTYDPPGEKNPENPELAITGEKRGATILSPKCKAITMKC